MRNWYAHYMQCLVYALQMPSKEIAEFYGKDIFAEATKMFYKYHCYGIDYFIRSFVEKYGSSVGVGETIRIGM